jgi:hypothetical protein
MATYKNVLLKKFATASTSYSTYQPNFIVDGLGNAANPPNQYRWISNTSKAGEWVQVDIGAMALIDKFILYTGNNTDTVNIANCIKNGDLQVMDEYGNWKTVASFRNNPDNGKKVELTFSPVVTDKIRLYFPIDEQQYRIFEVEAYGTIIGKKAIKKSTKNLFNVKDFDATKVIGGGTLWMYKFYGRPNTNYTFSTNAPLEGSLANFYAGGVNTGSNGYYAGSPRTVSSGTDGIITMYMRNENTTQPSEASKKLISGEYWIQIEEGSAATAHEDFKPLLKKAKKTNKNKNIFDGAIESGVLNASTGQPEPGVNIRSVNFTRVDPNEFYVMSYMNRSSEINPRYFWYDENYNHISNALGKVQKAPANAVWMKWHNGAMTLSDLIQIEKGTVATAPESFKGYERANKAAQKVPSYNLVEMDPAKWVKRPGTNNMSINGDTITLDFTADYAGANYFIPDGVVNGKTINVSRAAIDPNAAQMVFFYNQAGTNRYIAISDDTTNLTITVPANANQCRFYVQNKIGFRGTTSVSGIQVAIDNTYRGFTPFKGTNKAATGNKPLIR